MTPLFFQLTVGILAGASAGLFGWAGLRMLDIRVQRLRRPRIDISVDRIGEMLSQVPVPRPLALIWRRSTSQRALAQAGLNWDMDGFVGLRWAASWLAGLSVGVLPLVREVDLLSVFLAGVTVLAGLGGPRLWLNLRAERRRADIDMALPDFLDRLALGLEAGLSIEMAFRRTAANFRRLLGRQMRRVTRQIDRGHALTSALEDLAYRNPSSDLQAFVATVKQSEMLGTSLANTLRVQTRLLRAKRRRRAEEASRRLPVLVVFPLVLFFLPALLIIYLAPPLLHLFLGR